MGNLQRIAEALKVPLATLLQVAQVSSVGSGQKHSAPIFAESDSHVRPDGLMKRHLGYRVEFMTIARALDTDPEQLFGKVLRWSETEGTCEPHP